MSTRSPRNGTPSASRRRRWRSPFASDPSARTIRCQGTVGSSQTDEHRAGEARRAGGDVAVGADEARRGVADAARGRPARARSSGYRRALVRHGTYSIVAFDPATGEHGAAVHSHWFSVGSLCIWARPGIGAVATQSVVEPAHGPHGLDRLAAGDRARRDALAALLAAGRARGRAPGRDRRRGGPGRRPHRRRLHPVRGDATGAHVSAPGQHDGPGDGAGRDGGGLRGRRGRPRRPPDGRAHAAEGEGGDVRGRQSSALVVVPRAGEPWQRALRAAGRGPRRSPVEELRAAAAARARLRAGGRGRRADGLRPRRARPAALYERAAELAPESDELLFWAGLAQVHAGDVERGMAAVAAGDRAAPGLAHAARAALAGLRPRGRARPARAGLGSSDQQITCRWNARPALPPAASRWSTRTWFAAGPASTPRREVGRVAGDVRRVGALAHVLVERDRVGLRGRVGPRRAGRPRGRRRPACRRR